MDILGHSTQGRPIYGVLFGLPETTRLNTLIVGVFHGNEGVSGRLLERFIAHAQRNDWQGEPIDFSQQPTLIVSVLNPDGLALGLRTNTNRVDLNRNYPTQNWREENQGTPYYSGPAPGSEAETRLMMALIEQYQPQKIISVHSPYKVLNFDGPAQALAEAMAQESGYPVVADIGYPTPGSFGTYAGKERQIAVVTLELPPCPDDPDDSEEDLPPLETLDEVWQANRSALEAAIRF